MKIGRILFQIARFKPTGAFVGFAFTYCPWLIPVRKLRQNKHAVAFAHPRPSYPQHILIIPRKIARNVFCLSLQDFTEVITMAQSLRSSSAGDYALIINGGSRQDVMQAHFHLFSGNIAPKKAAEVDKSAFSLLIQFTQGGGLGFYII